MTDKQIYDLTEDDLLRCPVWFFPMDETAADELTVRPGFNREDYEYDKQCIVRASFETRARESFIGYVYWGKPEIVENLKPTMFLRGECITFWYGMMVPSFDDYGPILNELNKVFPIKFRSSEVDGFTLIEGLLEGLYFIDDNDVIQCKTPESVT
ncbi:hypothetical protein [Methylomonas rivi]|uniref:Uncharacterized protein n=1 Tax=Methylomonas rivi TaxID=2952226 RepID=A0ABT1UAE1_9GAMM|nr:hypothetical protein [Methylomonas sp. WSC-6]MCQ8130830.1 hypothetical protein [Methylomonas sp. WSC-6]